MVYRVYVERKPGFDGEAKALLGEVRSLLQIESVTGIRLLNRYDVEGISEELFQRCVPTVFSEPQTDNATFALPAWDGAMFAVEYLPGQFDQRADSASECIQLISQGERPVVRSARLYLLEGDITGEQLAAVKKYVINPVEAREASLEEKATLAVEYPIPTTVETLNGFIGLSREQLAEFVAQYGLAMDLDDIAFCQQYFAKEQRDPTITEIRMIDTYWSDHCRHTTFGTILDEVTIDDALVKKAWDNYLDLRGELYAGRSKPICLMDLATIGAKYLKKTGQLKNLDESEEINACTVKIKADVDGEEQDWLFLFKNETHNHPTEIEPFGGAATCIGGAIRDPLSGRSYVYQAMRVTGAGDPLVPVQDTMPGKLPQRKLVTTAAAGYSSYGNQIGLATGQVDELYHPGYVAKRMEIGAVVGAAPASNVRREVPAPGDIVVLLGGRTGRDGCGGATGSSKAHKLESLETCGAEVQKGNAPIERKLQRLFRDPNATRLIKRCNDFGAGGVSVAIGELADGLAIDLNAVPKKYDGLDGTELAISESQERMAVVLAPEDVDTFINLAHGENLEATVVAKVTAEPRLTMTWNGSTIVDISREFLNSNGAEKHMDAHVLPGKLYQPQWQGSTMAEKLHSLVTDLNVCSKKGLSERFDSTIGAATVTMPFGGKHQLTPNQAMVAKLPVKGETKTCSAMAWGYNPYIMEQSQYHGAYLAVVESIAKLVGAGFRAEDAYLTFQEYFERLGAKAERWGKPLAALLGALQAQLDLGVGSIGGKDSMSGSFENLDVPPTLVSFAVAIGNTDNVISPEFKLPGSKVVLLQPEYDDALLPNADSLKAVFAKAEELIAAGKVLSASTPGYGGIAEQIFKSGLGNRLGFRLADGIDPDTLLRPAYGSLILELAEETDAVGTLLGETSGRYQLEAGEVIDMAELQEAWEAKLEPVMPYRICKGGEELPVIRHTVEKQAAPKIGIARPHALIPVFPGTNCEYDTARALERAGAEAEIFVVNNLTPAAVAESCAALCRSIEKSQIVMLPGGFSGGDEPDGSAKFITAFLRAPAVKDAIHDLLKHRDGLMLGICNGFQALVKLGLVPFGEIRDMDENCPTLTFNTIGRHQSMLVRTRIASNLSPWFSRMKTDEIYTVAISHGEGRFVAPQAVLDQLAANGQIATQYVDLNGAPTMDTRFNPNGSLWAIEGITSPDGRVLGKMGHTERSADNLYKNVPGNKYQPLFEGGVDYFKL
ncbi:phosphoribosylformylglycinamidine synthase [Anaerofilum sp. An201]|nr:phosphoribosylformylglycinamidine synthase [Anaerofilum sp. An201]OUP02434.1 phosphoribosylformylglycinamidine synthase [Anaerofilum sp. An201]